MSLKHQKIQLAKDFNDNDWNGAVNVLTIENKIAMIVRSQDTPTHKGQIAFLGGHKEKSDLSPMDTAQREFLEETSIAPKLIDYEYYLPSVRTGGGKKIIPVTGKANISATEFLDQATSNGEWDQLLLIDLDYLKDVSNWQRVKTTYSTGDLYFVPLLSSSYLSKFPASEVPILWGATAKMLYYFLKLDN